MAGQSRRRLPVDLSIIDGVTAGENIANGYCYKSNWKAKRLRVGDTALLSVAKHTPRVKLPR
jgi:hypothetical protein